jgi:CubicO group peptidase (beta-lactamase class C family)
MLHSATKSFVSVAVGLAIQEGYFSLDSIVTCHISQGHRSGILAQRVSCYLPSSLGQRARLSAKWVSGWLAERIAVVVFITPGGTKPKGRYRIY